MKTQTYIINEYIYVNKYANRHTAKHEVKIYTATNAHDKY
jgi:hypothetical protein